MADPELKDLTSTSFGYLMAFLLPGMILLYGIGLWYPSLFPALQAADKADASIGPSIIYLLVCVAAGLIISAVRWVFYEKGVCRKKQFNPDHFNRLTWIIHECEVSSWAERPQRISEPPLLRVGRARSRRTPIAARNHSVAAWRSSKFEMAGDHRVPSTPRCARRSG